MREVAHDTPPWPAEPMSARDHTPWVMLVPVPTDASLMLMVKLPRRKAIPLTRTQAEALITLLEAYIDGVSQGYDHGGVGIQGARFDISPDAARMLINLLETALTYIGEDNRD